MKAVRLEEVESMVRAEGNIRREPKANEHILFSAKPTERSGVRFCSMEIKTDHFVDYRSRSR